MRTTISLPHKSTFRSTKRVKVDVLNHRPPKNQQGKLQIVHTKNDIDQNIDLKSFLIQYGSRYYYIESQNIAYVYRKEGLNVLVTKEGFRIPIQMSLKEILRLLNRQHFAAFSKDVIVNIDALKSINKNENDVMILTLEPDLGFEFQYAHPKNKELEKWLRGSMIDPYTNT